VLPPLTLTPKPLAELIRMVTLYTPTNLRKYPFTFHISLLINLSGNTVAACIFFYYGFYNIALSPLLVSYTVEILPFRIRSKGLMVMNLAVNCSLVFNQYANPIALGALKWKYYSEFTLHPGLPSPLTRIF
jgi:hypothetical protein